MKRVEIMRGPHKGKLGTAIKEENGEMKIIIDGIPAPVKVPIKWVRVLGFIGEMLILITNFFKRNK